MSDRYVGRVSVVRRRATGRAAAVPPAGPEPAASRVDPAVADATTPAPAVGRAEAVDSATAMFQPPDVTGAIFVDGSGRRGRRLRRVAYALVAVVLVLLLAFWLLQGLDVVGVLS